jgi:hypothetical protein
LLREGENTIETFKMFKVNFGELTTRRTQVVEQFSK